MFDAVIVGRGNPLCDSTDLIAEALGDIVARLGLEFKIISFLNYDDYEPKKALLWFFIGNPVFFKYIKGEPPEGLKIFLLHERLDHTMKGCTIHHDHMDCPVYVRNLPVSNSVSLGYRRHWRLYKTYIAKRNFIDVVFDYNPHNCDFFRSVGIKSVFVPVAYHKRFKFFEANGRSRKRITFLGRIVTMHRGVMRDRIKEECGVRIKRTRRASRVVVGRYLVSLNIHYDKTYSSYADRRMAMIISNGCLVVSERSDWSPFSDDFGIECEYDEIPQRCKEAIDGKLDGLETRTEEFYRTKFDFTNHVTRALESIGFHP